MEKKIKKILFPKEFFNLNQCVDYLGYHNFKFKTVTQTSEFFIFNFMNDINELFSEKSNKNCIIYTYTN